MNIYQLSDLYSKSNPGEQESPVLNLYFNKGMLAKCFGYDEPIVRPPFKVFIPKKKGVLLRFPDLTGVRMPRNTITTALRLEKMLLALFTSTNFGNIKDPKNIQRGRYLIDFYQLNVTLLEFAFDYILEHKNPRISKSWLEPIQERMLKKEEPTSKIKTKGKQKFDPHKYDDEDATYLEDDPQPIEVAVRSSFVQDLKRAEERLKTLAMKKPSAWVSSNFGIYSVDNSGYVSQKGTAVTTAGGGYYNPHFVVDPFDKVESDISKAYPVYVESPKPKNIRGGGINATWPLQHDTRHLGNAREVNQLRTMSPNRITDKMPNNTVLEVDGNEYFKDKAGFLRRRPVVPPQPASIKQEGF